MAQQIEPTSLVPSSKSVDFPRIAAFFDALDYIVERTESLIWKSKRLVFGVAFMVFLIYELVLFGMFLLHNLPGGVG